MPGIETTTLPILLLMAGIVLVAALVHGTLGLGFPMVATPLLALLTDVRSAILITLLPTLCVNIASILKGGGWHQSIGTFWPIALYVCCGSLVGTYLLIVADPTPFKLLLAAIIMLYLNLDRLSKEHLGWLRSSRPLGFALVGLSAGFLAGTVNVMVPILIIYFLGMGLPPTTMVQVFNLCFFSGKITQLAVFAHAGALEGGVLAATTPLAAVALLALLGGMAVRGRVEAETYRQWLRKVLFVIALILLLQFLWETYSVFVGFR